MRWFRPPSPPLATPVLIPPAASQPGTGNVALNPERRGISPPRGSAGLERH